MKNRICLITGANAGIGKETALALAKQGATVVMMCRNEDKAKTAKQDIIQQTGNTDIHIILCDLNDLNSVKKAALEFNQTFPSLHVLINNAGFMTLEKQLSANGFEATMAVNHLAHALLTHLLLDKLKASTPARIINISSAAHKMAKLDCEDLMMTEQPYKGFTAYSNSKLANILHAYQLANMLAESGVTANALDPGMVQTEFGDKVEFPLSARIFTFFLRPWVKTAAEGASTSIKLACEPDLEKITGTFWKNDKQASSSKDSSDPILQTHFWKKTEELLHPYMD